MSRRRGWFPDHWDPNVLRYWDGASWTSHVVSATDVECGKHLEVAALIEAERALEPEPVKVAVAATSGGPDVREVFGRRAAAVNGRAGDKPARRAPDEAPAPLPKMHHDPAVMGNTVSKVAVLSAVAGALGLIGAMSIWWLGTLPCIIAIVAGTTATSRIHAVKFVTGRPLAIAGVLLGVATLCVVAVGAFNALTDAGELRAAESSASAQRPKIVAEFIDYVNAQDGFRTARGAYSVDESALRPYGYSRDPGVDLISTGAPGPYCVSARSTGEAAWWHVSAHSSSDIREGRCP